MNKMSGAGFRMVIAALMWGLFLAGPVLADELKGSSGQTKIDFSDLQRLAQSNTAFARQVLMIAAQEYQRIKEPKKSVGMYKQALGLFPSDMQLTEDMATAQLAAGDIEGGLASWKQILDKQGKDVGTRIRYANYLSDAKQGDKGIAVMRDLIKERPEDDSLRYWVADTYVRFGKNAEAEKEFHGMLKDFPKEATEIQRRLNLLKPPAPPAPAPAPPKAAPAPAPAVLAPAPAAPTKMSVAAPAQASQSKVEEKIKKTEKNKKSEKKKGWI